MPQEENIPMKFLKKGGGTELKSVQQQTLDRSHKEQPHWEAGKIKMDKDIPQFNKYNRPKLKSDKSKTYYIDE